jgi:hypothetical protein
MCGGVVVVVVVWWWWCGGVVVVWWLEAIAAPTAATRTGTMSVVSCTLGT